MQWYGEKQKNHSNTFYFSSCKIQGYKKKNIKEITYPNIPSTIRHVPCRADLPILTPTVNLDYVEIHSEEEYCR